MLVNELIKYKKQFRLMAYPNRSHSISEGEGTFAHLSTLFTELWLSDQLKDENVQIEGMKSGDLGCFTKENN